MSDRPRRRVPPPPPPGFGDDEYYKLYGNPEEYQKYRNELARAKIREGDVSPPQHEEYYVYRRYSSHEESYDYYYGPHSEPSRPRKRRIAPPPPPGFESPGRRRPSSRSPARGGRGTRRKSTDGGRTRGKPFENFKVTIKTKNRDDTPSLSDSDDDKKKSKLSKKKRKKKDKERRKKLEKKLQQKEEELMGLAERNKANLLPKKKSIKDRLGGPILDSSQIKQEKEDHSDRLDRSGTAPSDRRGRSASSNQDDRDRSSTKSRNDRSYSEDKRSRTGGKRNRDRSEPGRGERNRTESRNKRDRSGSPADRKKKGGRGQEDLLSTVSRAERRMRNQERSPIVIDRKRKRSGGSKEDLKRSAARKRSGSRRRRSRSRGGGRRGRSGSKGGPARKRRRRGGRRRRRDRRPRDRRRGMGISQNAMQDLKDENKQMQARLKNRTRGKGTKNDGKIIDRLNLLAGIDGIKTKRGSRSRSRGSDSDSDDSEDRSDDSGSDSRSEDSGSDSDRDEKRKRKAATGRMRSDKVDGRREKGREDSKEKWTHDKFQKYDSVEGKDEAFGSHWSRIKSEKEKLEDRNRSKSRSRSGKRGKRRRRGKFSRSRSRSSSSESSSSSRSSSRSRSGSSRSSRSSRSRSSSSRRSRSNNPPPPPKKDAAPPAADNEVAAAAGGEAGQDVEKEGVNLGLSGALAAESNTFNGTVIKYSEPPEARKPKKKWRLYVFKGEDEMPILYIHRQSAYLCGRDRKVADIPLDHPSCSKQHSALQYRLVSYTRDDGTTGRRVTPYVMDLGSANGTYVNNNRIEPQKYVQLLEKDVLKFGFSSREYVLLHDQSKEDEEDLGVD